MTDLFRRCTMRRYAAAVRGSGGRPNLGPAGCLPPEEQNNGVDGDDGDPKEQSGDDHHHVVAWVGHQNICGDLLSEGHEAVHTCERRERGGAVVGGGRQFSDALLASQREAPVRV